jgi:hypothetical protein
MTLCVRTSRAARHGCALRDSGGATGTRRDEGRTPSAPFLVNPRAGLRRAASFRAEPCRVVRALVRKRNAESSSDRLTSITTHSEWSYRRRRPSCSSDSLSRAKPGGVSRLHSGDTHRGRKTVATVTNHSSDRGLSRSAAPQDLTSVAGRRAAPMCWAGSLQRHRVREPAAGLAEAPKMDFATTCSRIDLFSLPSSADGRIRGKAAWSAVGPPQLTRAGPDQSFGRR